MFQTGPLVQCLSLGHNGTLKSKETGRWYVAASMAPATDKIDHGEASSGVDGISVY